MDDLGTTVVLVGEYKRASGDFSRFTYSDAPQSTASDSQPCKVKKKKKGGGK